MPQPLDNPRKIVADVDASAERRRTPCGDGTMLWRLWGDGPPLVLLHGAFGSWTHWLRNIPGLAAERRLYVPDMPGYGGSAMLPPPLDAEHLAAIVGDGLARLLPAPIELAIAGFSFGGIVAGHLAARLGARVRQLILIGPNGMAHPVPEISGLRPLVQGMTAAEVRAVHRHNLNLLMLADAASIDDLAVHLQMENARGARFKSGTIPGSDSLLRALPAVRARISGIWGERDALAGRHLRCREAVLRRFQPDLDFRLVPGAGHWVTYEAPAAVNAAMLAMLKAG